MSNNTALTILAVHRLIDWGVAGLVIIVGLVGVVVYGFRYWKLCRKQKQEKK